MLACQTSTRAPASGRTLGVAHLAGHEQRHAGVLAIIEPGFAFAQRGTGHIERAFDGARGATGAAGLFVLGIQQQIQIVLQAEAGDQQSGFLARAQVVEVAHRLPEFLGRHLQVLDHADAVGEDTVHDGLEARIAGVLLEAAGDFKELLHIGGLGKG